MARLLRFSSISFRDLLTIYAPFVLLVGGLLWVAYVTIDPTPPNTIVMAAGLEGSAYQDFAQRYRTILARHRIDVRIQSSDGSMHNLHSLNTSRSDADVAFVQSGTTDGAIAERHGLVSIGSLFVEPVWIFYRQAALTKVKAPPVIVTDPRVPIAVARARPVRQPVATAKKPIEAITQLSELRGLSLNVGPKGSGGPRLANQLLDEGNHVDMKSLTLSYLEDTPAVVRLLDGSLDAVMLVSAPETPIVRMLLQTPGIRLFNFEQAEAYSRRFAFLKHVVLPRGIVALDRDIPHEDVHLIAPTATLVARADTHPAIIELLVQAAAEIHGGASWFQHAGEFPNDQYTEIPLSPVAERYYKSGPPFLQRYLPFWLANLIERMGVILLPIVALLIPLSRVLPPLYSWRVRKRVYRWYGQLRDVENAIDQDLEQAGEPDQDPRDARPAARRNLSRARHLARLTDIETRVNHLVVPLS